MCSGSHQCGLDAAVQLCLEPGPGKSGIRSAGSSLMDESALERYFDDSIANVSTDSQAAAELFEKPKLYSKRFQ